MKLVTMSWVGAGAIAAAIGGWLLTSPGEKPDPKAGPGGTAVVEQPSGKVVAVGKDDDAAAKTGSGDAGTGKNTGGADNGDGSANGAGSDPTTDADATTAKTADTKDTDGDGEKIAAVDSKSGAATPAPDADAKSTGPDTSEPVDPNVPAFDLVRIDPDGQTVLAGRAAPNQRVEILLDGKVVETATTDANGTFVAILQTDLGNTARNLQLRVPAPVGAVTSVETTAGGAADATKTDTADATVETSGSDTAPASATTGAGDDGKDDTDVAAADTSDDTSPTGDRAATTPEKTDTASDAETGDRTDVADNTDTADTSDTADKVVKADPEETATTPDRADADTSSDDTTKQATETGDGSNGDGEKLAVAGDADADPAGSKAETAPAAASDDTSNTSADADKDTATGAGDATTTSPESGRAATGDADRVATTTDTADASTDDKTPAKAPTSNADEGTAGSDTPANDANDAKTAVSTDQTDARTSAVAKTEDSPATDTAPKTAASAETTTGDNAGKTATPADDAATDVADADTTTDTTKPDSTAEDPVRKGPAAVAAGVGDDPENVAEDKAADTDGPKDTKANDPTVVARDLSVPTLTGPDAGSDTGLSTGGTGERVARAPEGAALSAPDGPKPAPANNSTAATAPTAPEGAPKRLEPAAPSPAAPDDLSAAPAPEAGSQLRAGTEDRPVTGGRQLPKTAAETATTGDAPTVPERTADKQFLTSAPVIILPAADPDKPPTLLSSTREDLKVLQPSISDIDGVVLDRITYTDTGDVRLSGRGRAGRAVRVYGNGALLSTTRVAKNGNWTLFVNPERGKKIKLLRLDELDSSGNVTTRIEAPFTYSRSSPKEVRQRQVVVQKGDMLWRIAEQHYGEGLRYSVIYGANATLIRNPDLIYPGQVFSIPELVDAPAKP